MYVPLYFINADTHTHTHARTYKGISFKCNLFSNGKLHIFNYPHPCGYLASADSATRNVAVAEEKFGRARKAGRVTALAAWRRFNRPVDKCTDTYARAERRLKRKERQKKNGVGGEARAGRGGGTEGD